MTDKYYITIDEDERGPYSLRNVENMIYSGNISADTPVRKGDTGTWKFAKVFDELHPAFRKDTTSMKVGGDGTGKQPGHRRYYFRMKGSEIDGPYYRDELRNMYESGEIENGTPLMVGKTKDWIAYEEIDQYDARQQEESGDADSSVPGRDVGAGDAAKAVFSGTARSGEGPFLCGVEGSREVVVADIQMPFGSMVVFMVKWAIASIPATIILSIIFGIVASLFWITVGAAILAM